MRVAFLGNAGWSVPSLEAVAASRHHVVLVATRSPRPAGRGNQPRPTPVAEAARRHNLPLREIETVKEGIGFEALAQAEPDALAVVAYGEIIPQRVLVLPKVAPVNVHFSLLPALRGAAPVQRAILEGRPVTGVTTIRMDAGMDTGPILLQRGQPVRPDDDAETLGERLATVAGKVLVETLDDLAEGSVQEQPQDESKATYAPKLRPADRVIDWSNPADAILRRIRAMSPEPGAETRFRGKVLKVFAASPTAVPREAPLTHTVAALMGPGRIHVGDDDAPAVATGNGGVRLDLVALEGRKRMTGEDFVRGYRPERGEILG